LLERGTLERLQRGIIDSRDGKSDRPQIVFGLITNAAGCPAAMEVFAGNTSDSKTLVSQIAKVRERFGLQRIVLVGDRG
jgi:transposase